MKVTIYDVAKKANVSISTVSKVINKKGKISKETQHRVFQAIEELNFQPSVVASALTSKRALCIGMLVPDLSNPFFAEMVRSVEEVGHQLGYQLMICYTNNNQQEEENYISLLRKKRVDGIILATGMRKGTLTDELNQSAIPVAVMARDIPELEVDTVLVDDYMGGYLAASHLIELGHKRMAVISEDLNVTSSQERKRGFLKAMKDHELLAEPEWFPVSDSSIDVGREAARELLRNPQRPTAIFAFNDLLAVGVIQAAKEMNIKIPDELSIVGFDNTIFATIIDPPLTTIAQPVQDMGRHVMEVLNENITVRQSLKRRILLMPNLIVRNTTAPCQDG